MTDWFVGKVALLTSRWTRLTWFLLSIEINRKTHIYVRAREHDTRAAAATNTTRD